jgi:hypothetical protein
MDENLYEAGITNILVLVNLVEMPAIGSEQACL